MIMEGSQWIRTSERLPEDDRGVVAGLWQNEEGEQIIALCHYEHEDKTWYEDDAEESSVCTVLKSPLYWIDIPKQE